ncbi:MULTISPECIES: helix-turn-helix domain-containing protein [Streptomyces]|uniref:helix-turn-helix domain-containing protein n=1 Tax=Streptomyces TaxID=1883 RepID=UPI0016749B5F|nr:helix-turn-helix domain-containing protein [Streptomyces canarius]
MRQVVIRALDGRQVCGERAAVTHRRDLHVEGARGERGQHIVEITPGTLCVRDAQVPREFSYRTGTRAQVLLVPSEALADAGLGQLPALTLVSPNTPEARLLPRQLHLIGETRGGLGPAGVRDTRQSVSQLLGKHTVSAVAARWHFADMSHFSRTFKRHFGETPSSLAH